MKILSVCLPSVMLAGLFVGLSMQSLPAKPVGDATARLAERSKLEQERRAIASRLEELNVSRHLVAPRGGL